MDNSIPKSWMLGKGREQVSGQPVPQPESQPCRPTSAEVWRLFAAEADKALAGATSSGQWASEDVCRRIGRVCIRARKEAAADGFGK